jgi:hypothetical protein
VTAPVMTARRRRQRDSARVLALGEAKKRRRLDAAAGLEATPPRIHLPERLARFDPWARACAKEIG